MKQRYTNEFKLMVIKDYYTNDLGVRQTANKWRLPSKNYIERWETKLTQLNLIPPDWVKKPPLKASSHPNVSVEDMNPVMAAVMAENERLRCELDFYRELDKLQSVKKKINTK